MVRTKDTANVKASGAKASRKITAPVGPAALNTSDSKNKYSGGNPYCPRETPAWQKPITQFFPSNSKDVSSTVTSGEFDSTCGSNTEATTFLDLKGASGSSDDINSSESNSTSQDQNTQL